MDITQFARLACSTLLALAVTEPAVAEVFCIDPDDVPIGMTMTDVIQGSLAEASGNDEDDAIRFRAGTYAVAGELIYDTEAATSHKKLILSGGWNEACTSRTAGTSTLDGQPTSDRILRLNLAGADSVRVEHLILYRGGDTAAAGIRIDAGYPSSKPTIELDSLRFGLGEAYTSSAAALGAYGKGALSVRNSLFVENVAAFTGAISAHWEGPANFTNNTVTGNNSGMGACAVEAEETGSAHFAFSNNVIWGNAGGGDLCLKASADGFYDMAANDIGVCLGCPVDWIEGNQSVDPQFDNLGNLDRPLKRSSPLVDAGYDNPGDGLPSYDILGLPRKIGPHVDIGAYELDRLFADGFEIPAE
jgi:hypothetical protein